MNRRFWVSYAAALVVFASLISLVSSFAYVAEGVRLGIDGRILPALVRSSAPMAAGSALLLALALWGEALPLASLSGRLEPSLRRALSLARDTSAAAYAEALNAAFAEIVGELARDLAGVKLPAS